MPALWRGHAIERYPIVAGAILPTRDGTLAG